MFDPVIIIPKLFESMAKEAGSKVLNGIFGSLSKFRDALTMNFSEYLHSAINRTSYVKTLLHRDQSVNLFSIYVERFLQSGSVTIRDDNLIEVICNSAAIMVIGSAGSGKTMLIRHLFLQLVENTHGLMPIFIELRRFNSSLSKDSIIDFIYDTVVRPGAVVTKSQFCDCLRENMFVLILDGLDEVEHDARQEVSDQIANLREAYPNLGIVISSRPDHRLEAWSDFEIYRIQSMRKDQVKALLSKLPWDPEVRTRFIEEVDKHLYAKHENFLSNPLLATMMLMTFDQYANIPDKMHIFYDHAFQTLFDRHDAGKQGWYGRKNYTLLDINQFKNCLSALCIHSYDFKKLLFSEAEILEYISIAVEQEGLDVKPRDYLSDLLESTCVLQRDGLYITFTHRSFQEYFAAYYLSRSPSFPIAEALDDFCKRTSDNVIWMAWDMNSGVLEREWVLPRTTDLAQKLRRCDYQNNMMEILSALELRFRVSNILDDRNRELTLQMTGSGRDLFITFSKMYAKIFEPVNLLFEGVGNSKRDAGIVGRAWERRRSTAIELGSSDHEWVVNTTIGELIVEIRNTILRLAETVEASVGKKKGERFYKKHGGELEKN